MLYLSFTMSHYSYVGPTFAVCPIVCPYMSIGRSHTITPLYWDTLMKYLQVTCIHKQPSEVHQVTFWCVLCLIRTTWDHYDFTDIL